MYCNVTRLATSNTAINNIHKNFVIFYLYVWFLRYTHGQIDPDIQADGLHAHHNTPLLYQRQSN